MVVLCAALVVQLVACSAGESSRPDRARDSDDGSGGPTADSGSYDTLVVSMWGDETLFSPLYGSWSEQLLFEPLFRTWGQREPTPRLVTRWEHSDDYRTWTYHLRTDVRWHDGVPLTAHDVKFTMELQMHPPPGAANWAPGSRVVEVIDDSTFRVTYREASGPYYTRGATIWPEHLLKDLDPDEFWNWEFWKQPVGSGAYRYVRHVPQSLIELEAVPAPSLDTPRIERVILKFGGEPRIELVSGNVDAIEVPADAATVRSLADDPRYRVYYEVGPGQTLGLYWNHRTPLLRNADTRRALTLAIDRRELGRIVHLPDDAPIVDVPLPPFPRGLRMDDPWPYDPEEARRILDAQGWRDEDGDGILERDGTEFRFTAVASNGGGYDTQRAAVYVQAKLAEVGVHMEIQPLAGFAMVKRALEAGEADAFFQRFLFRELTHAVWDDYRAPIGFEPPEGLRQLFTDAEESWDLDERRRLLEQALHMFREEVPVTVLYPSTPNLIAHRKVKGFRMPDRVSVIEALSELWIEEEAEDEDKP